MVPALTATRGMWKVTVMPRKKARVPFQRTFTKAEFTKLTRGFIPQSMDDRWFIFFEKGWLYFHRSWTGYCIFQLRFKNRKPGYQIAEVWVNQNPHQYHNAGVEREARLISTLIGPLLSARRA
jgi:hypothetical protein